MKSLIARRAGRLSLLVLVPLLSVATASARSGNYLVVTAQEYAGSTPLTQLIDHRTSQGFNVQTHVVTPGTSNTDIRAYIRSLWGMPDAPEYVLIVGDTSGFTAGSDTIPHWTGGGPKSAATDLPYACMDAGDDWFPELAVGRFSVRDVATLQVVVDKTIQVESGSYPDPDFTNRVALLATGDDSSGAEEIHDWVADNVLAPNNVSINKIYADLGGGTQDVFEALNTGTLIMCYMGHSGSSGWWDPSFSQTNIAALQNEGLYGLVFGFSCSTNHFEYENEVFGETWIREPNKGAAAYISASTFIYWTQSPWHESQNLEKFFFQSMYDQGIWEVGPAWRNALYMLKDEYGATDVIRDHFEMFPLLGDPALRLPGSCSDEGTVLLGGTAYMCEDTVSIEVADCGLNLDNQAIDTVDIVVASGSEPAGETVTLTETAPFSAKFEGTLLLSTIDSAGVLLVTHGDTVEASYLDEDNGSGQQVIVTDTALVDCVAPQLLSVDAVATGPESAEVAIELDEPATATVRYGLSCGSLTDTVVNPNYSSAQVLQLTNLTPLTDYYFELEITDVAGNSLVDDNGGTCYDVRTLAGPAPVLSFPLDLDPLWSMSGQWEFGTPLGGGGTQHGNPDPTAGATGTNVLGVNLAGDYSTSPGGPYYVTSSPVDLTGISSVSLRFSRWLNSDYPPYVANSVEASNNGTDWTVVWEGSGEMTDNAWSEQELDISAIADDQPAVQVRWGYQVGTAAWAYSGWNIDDIEFWGSLQTGDMNCDGSVNFDDISPFVIALSGEQAYYQVWPGCRWENADCDYDGDVDFDDISAFIACIQSGGC